MGSLVQPPILVERATNRLKELQQDALSTRRLPNQPRSRQSQRRLGRAEVTELVAAYRAGGRLFELADQFGISRKTARCILVRQGIPIRSRSLSPAELTQAAQLYAAGWSLAKIGDQLGRDGTTVWRGLKAMGLDMRRPWERL